MINYSCKTLNTNDSDEDVYIVDEFDVQDDGEDLVDDGEPVQADDDLGDKVQDGADGAVVVGGEGPSDLGQDVSLDLVVAKVVHDHRDRVHCSCL